MKISPFVRNVNRVEKHLQDLDLYLTAKSQTNTIDKNDVAAMKEFMAIVGRTFDFNTKREPWWNANLYATITKDINELIDNFISKSLSNDAVVFKSEGIETMLEALNEDIAIELRSAVKESCPALLVLFPPEKICR